MADDQEVAFKVKKLLDSELIYKPEAYGFALAVLHHTLAKLSKRRHISGQELLEGIRAYALEQFGPMARTVLNYWGIRDTTDFGKIVFALVEAGLMQKCEEDSIEDFRGGFDFQEAFDKKYEFKDG